MSAAAVATAQSEHLQPYALPAATALKGGKGFKPISCLERPRLESYLQTAVRRFLPSRDDARWRLICIIRLFGLQETASIMACPTWLVEGWLNGSGMLYGAQKRHIWVTWCLFFAPHKLRSAFDIITSGRFVPDPATGELGGLKAEWKRKARRTDAYQAAARRVRKKKRKKRK